MIRELWQRLLPRPAWTRRASDPLLAADAKLPDVPLVSVVMTVYNGSPWVESAMDSILQQSWSKIELIVVDDASTDSAPEIIRSVAARDGRVKFHRLSLNGGTYAAKNHGIDHAQGDVITFMDSDDYSEPARLGKQLELLRHPGQVASTCNYVRVDGAGRIVLNRGLEQRQALISLMIKRQVVDDIGWFDSVRIAADDEFFERLRHVYGRSAHTNVPEPLYRARIRAESLSSVSSSPVNLSGPDSQALSVERARYKQGHTAWREELTQRGLRPHIPRNAGKCRAFDGPSLNHGTGSNSAREC